LPIVLKETQRALFYAPFYAALARDAYAAAGVDVALEPGGVAADAVQGVASGSADVAWGGPMRVMVSHDRDAASDLVCFCEGVARDPFLLVGRERKDAFELRDLVGLRLGAVREAPTPWMCLQDDLRRAGVDPARVHASFDRSIADNATALQRNELDVIQTIEPIARALVNAGEGFLWHVAAHRGPTSYTCFYARRQVLQARRPELLMMTRAVHQTQQWLHRSSAEEIAATIGSFFADVGPALLAQAITHYRSLGIWGRDPRLARSGYERLQQALLSGGLIRSALPYERGVDNSLAEEGMAHHG